MSDEQKATLTLALMLTLYSVMWCLVVAFTEGGLS